jgi:hypothetical protein
LLGPPGDAVAACSALVKSDFSTTRDAPSLVVSAEVKAASAEMPRHCLVNGQIAPTIGYRMWLPVDSWIGKLNTNQSAAASPAIIPKTPQAASAPP